VSEQISVAERQIQSVFERGAAPGGGQEGQQCCILNAQQRQRQLRVASAFPVLAEEAAAT
jgi:hypothetical protein